MKKVVKRREMMKSLLVVDEKNIRLLLTYISKCRTKNYSFPYDNCKTFEIKTKSSKLVLFDITLPEMDGLRFLELFSSDKENYQLLDSFDDHLLEDDLNVSNYTNL